MENPTPQRRFRRGIYILPNLFTTANMFCGFFAIVSAIQGQFMNAAWSIMVAIAFDSMDGRVARLTRATSAFGVQYDSLSDLISFGMAPAIITYRWCLEPFGRLGWLAAFLYLVCGALRLARFNVMTNEIPKSYFQGLPSPVAAATVATSVIFYNEMNPAVNKDTFMLVVTFLLASLMISTVRFPSFKDVKFNRENSFGILAVVILTLVLIAVKPEVTLFLMSICYIVIGSAVDLARVLSPKDSKNPREVVHNHKQ